MYTRAYNQSHASEYRLVYGHEGKQQTGGSTEGDKMRKTMMYSVMFLLAALAFTAQTEQAHAQSLSDLTAGKDKKDPAYEKKKKDLLFGAGTVDLTVGIGGFFYPHIEPGLDVGIIPLPADLSISLGLNVDVGYCVGCLLFGVLDDLSGSNIEMNVGSWYVAPQLRGLIHLGAISDLIRTPELDLYVGLGAGPALFRFTVDVTDKTDSSKQVNASQTILTGFGGPIAGLRYMLGDTFFVGIEARYFISVSVENQSVDFQGEQVSVDQAAYIDRRFGSDYNLSFGLRF